jgi:hypothetical protein
MDAEAITGMLFIILIFAIMMALITEHRMFKTFDLPIQIDSSQIGSEAELLELLKKNKHFKLTVKLHTFKEQPFVLVGYRVPGQEYTSYVVPIDQLLQKHAKAILMLEKKGSVLQLINEIENALSNCKRVVIVSK